MQGENELMLENGSKTSSCASGKRGIVKRAFSRYLPRLNTPARASAFYTVGNLLSKAAALVFTPFFTRAMSPAEYGEYSLFNSYLSILTILGTLEVCGGVLFRALQKFRTQRVRLLKHCALLVLLSISVCFLGFMLIRRITNAEPMFMGAIPLLFFSLVAGAGISIYLSSCKFSYKYKSVFAVSVLQSLLAPLLALVLIRLSQSSGVSPVTIRVGIGVAVSLMLAIPLYVYIFSEGRLSILSFGRKRTDAEHQLHIRNIDLSYPADADIESESMSLLSSWKYLLQLCLPMLPYYIGIMVISSADKLIIARFMGDAALGSYSVAYSMAIALNALTSGITQSLTPWVMRKVRAGEYAKIRGLALGVCELLLPITVIFLCFTPELFSLLAPDEYSEAAVSVYAIVLCSVPLFLSSFVSAAALARERVRCVVFSGACAAVLNIGINLILVPRFGFLASAVAVPLSYLIVLLLGSSSFRFYLGEKLIYVNKTLQILAFCAFFAMILYTLRSHLLIRILVAFTFLAVLAFKLYSFRALLSEKDAP